MAPHEVLVVPLGSGPELALVKDGTAGKATAAIWPGVGAQSRCMAQVRLAPGSSTIQLWHESEAVYYVRSGAGTVHDERVGIARVEELCEGAIVHLGRATAHRFTAEAVGPGLELVGGPCPPEPSWFADLASESVDAATPGTDRSRNAARITSSEGRGIQVLSRDEPELMLPIISSDARMIAWPGNGAWDATMNYVRMGPGEENRPHAHPESEDTIVILEGRGSVDDLTSGRTLEFSAGDVIHVPVRVRHAVRANRGETVVSVGGPCPADVAFLRACGATLPDRPER